MSSSNVDSLINAFSKRWKEIINKEFKCAHNNPIVEETILFYLGYKTLKICMTYESFGRIINIESFSDASFISKEQVNTIIEKIRSLEEDNHITLKINQCLTF